MLLRKDGVPEDVKSIVNEIKNQLKQICKQKEIDFESIIEYIDGQFDVFSRSSLKQIGEKRRNVQIEKILRDINQVKYAMQNGINHHHVLEQRKDEDRRINYMEDYTFEKMWMNLRDGYQIYYTYVGNRYLLFKTAENCYTQKLLSNNKKNPQPKMLMLTLKRVKEMFPNMEDIEFKVVTTEFD